MAFQSLDSQGKGIPVPILESMLTLTFGYSDWKKLMEYLDPFKTNHVTKENFFAHVEKHPEFSVLFDHVMRARKRGITLQNSSALLELELKLSQTPRPANPGESIRDKLYKSSIGSSMISEGQTKHSIMEMIPGQIV